MSKVSDDPRFQKRYEQNIRLLKEFSWLWGVWQRWQLGYDNLYVSKPDERLKEFLYTTTPDPSIEMWAYIEHHFVTDSIERIEYRSHTPLYAHRIRDYAQATRIVRVRYLALAERMERGDCLVLPSHTRVCIYRPFKKMESLDEFIDTPPNKILT